MSRRRTGSLRWIVLSAVALSCSPPNSPLVDVSHDDGGDAHLDDPQSLSLCERHPDQRICDTSQEVICDAEGREVRRQDCPEDMHCVQELGCVACTAGERRCDGNTVQECHDNQRSFRELQVCDPHSELCDGELGACVNQCARAAERMSNIGCDYIAVDMSNHQNPGDRNGACFVAFVSNVQTEGAALVTVEDEEGTLLDFPSVGTEWVIAPQELAVIPLTGGEGQCSLSSARPNTMTMNTGLFPGSVFRIKSTLPVVAYQMNPYEAADRHTTDASLLIPVPALGEQYITANHEGPELWNHPSSMSVVALHDDTVVTIDPSVDVSPGGPVPSGDEPFEVTLSSMEHLQVLGFVDLDLTNTVVSASAPIAVFSGATCTYVPRDMPFCDHLEEMMPPISSWGTRYVAAVPARRALENGYWRVIAAVDNTQVRVEPYGHYDRILNRGDVLEIDEYESFLITSEAAAPDPLEDVYPIMVINYLKGAAQTAFESGTTIDGLANRRGDPSMTLSIPTEQYLDSYVFLTDPTYAFNYVIVVREDPSHTIHLDCWDPIPDSAFSSFGVDGYQRAEVILDAEFGHRSGDCGSWGDVHRIWSEYPFAIWVYGYYADTSYGYPGGMNLEQINDVIVPIY